MFSLIRRLIERTVKRRKQKKGIKDKKRGRVEKLRADEHVFIEGKWF